MKWTMIISIVFLASCASDSFVLPQEEIPPPNLFVDEVLWSEGNTQNDASVKVYMDRQSDHIVAVSYNLVPQTASEEDFLFSNGSVFFYPGETEKTFQVRLLGDRLKEPDEFFEILVFGSINGSVRTPSVRFTIADDD